MRDQAEFNSYGGSSAPPTAKRQSHVENELSKLESSIADIDRSINMHIERIQVAVRVDDGPQPAGLVNKNETKPEGLVPLAERIRTSSIRIMNLTRLLDEVTERTEL